MFPNELLFREYRLSLDEKGRLRFGNKILGMMGVKPGSPIILIREDPCCTVGIYRGFVYPIKKFIKGARGLRSYYTSIDKYGRLLIPKDFRVFTGIDDLRFFLKKKVILVFKWKVFELWNRLLWKEFKNLPLPEFITDEIDPETYSRLYKEELEERAAPYDPESVDFANHEQYWLEFFKDFHTCPDIPVFRHPVTGKILSIKKAWGI